MKRLGKRDVTAQKIRTSVFLEDFKELIIVNFKQKQYMVMILLKTRANNGYLKYLILYFHVHKVITRKTKLKNSQINQRKL